MPITNEELAKGNSLKVKKFVQNYKGYFVALIAQLALTTLLGLTISPPLFLAIALLALVHYTYSPEGKVRRFDSVNANLYNSKYAKRLT